MEERIQKVLAHMGFASRREIEQWIREGRIVVNGQPAQLGDKVDPGRDAIRVDGKSITKKAEPLVYYLLNKPRGVVSTLSDPERRKTVADLIRGIRFRVYPAGRLDFDSEGLMLLTNDGDLARDLMHPSKKIKKVYEVKIQGTLSDTQIQSFRNGMVLDEGKTKPAGLVPVRSTDRASWWEVTLVEGRRRQIRRMFEKIGHRVQRLRRVRIGPLRLSGLKPGEHRPLTETELARLRETIASRS